jgi:hypothetical protein
MVALTEVGQNTSVSRIIEKLMAFPTWNAISIGDRHWMMVDLARDVWKTTPSEDRED